MPSITPISEKQRLYLPTLNGEIVQMGIQRAVVLPLASARDHHLPWVSRMAEFKDSGFPEYWAQAEQDLRWAIAEVEALAERVAA